MHTENVDDYVMWNTWHERTNCKQENKCFQLQMYRTDKENEEENTSGIKSAD